MGFGFGCCFDCCLDLMGWFGFTCGVCFGVVGLGWGFGLGLVVCCWV